MAEQSVVVRWVRKPGPARAAQMAARYEPDGGPPAYALAQVASKACLGGAALAEAVYPDGTRVLVVRWTRVTDLGSRIEHLVIRPGHWLAYDPYEGYLYEASDANWDQFYDGATIKQDDTPHNTSRPRISDATRRSSP